MINRHSQVYLCFTILHFANNNNNNFLHFALRFVPVLNAAVHVLVRREHGMSDKQSFQPQKFAKIVDKAVYKT